MKQQIIKLTVLNPHPVLIIVTIQPNLTKLKAALICYSCFRRFRKKNKLYRLVFFNVNRSISIPLQSVREL